MPDEPTESSISSEEDVIFDNNDNNEAEDDQKDSHDKKTITIDRLHSKLTI